MFFKNFLNDIDSIIDRDPAASSRISVILLYLANLNPIIHPKVFCILLFLLVTNISENFKSLSTSLLIISNFTRKLVSV